MAINARFQFRHDTASNWIANNPLLLLGEMGSESNTGKFKVGDGITLWNDLPYSSGSQGNQGTQGTTGTTGSQGNQGNQGTTGATGSQGNQGNQGTQGTTGTTGSQGNQGN